METRSIEEIINGRRYAWIAVQETTDVVAAIVIDGEDGYYPQYNPKFLTLEEAQVIADSLNKRIGISRDEAAKLSLLSKA